MAIDLGVVSGTASSAAPKNKAATSNSAHDSDFSRTLSASRATRERGTDATDGGKAAQHDQTDHKSAPAGPDRVAKHNGQPEHESRDSAAPADAAKTAGSDTPTEAHADLTRRRLSSVSRLASQATATKETAAKNQAAAALDAGQTQTAAQSVATTVARTAADATTAGSDTRKTARPANDKPTAADDKTHPDSDQSGSTGPIAALIQAPLIATQTVKPGSGSQTTVDDATSGRASAAADSLRGSWQQLFARLDSNAGHGHSNGQNQAGGDSPAQLLAVLTANGSGRGQSPGQSASNVDDATRFGILQAADNPAGNASASPVAGIGGHGLHATAAAQTAPAGTGAAATTASLTAPLASDDWNHALGQQTLRLAGSGRQQAQIQLHPRELGQINISVSVNDQNQAQIHFAAAHGHVRDAVEAALPQLRQSLAAGGLSLGQASVGDQSSQAAFAGGDGHTDRRGGQQSAGDTAAVGDMAIDSVAAAPVSRGPGHIGGIDIFA